MSRPNSTLTAIRIGTTGSIAQFSRTQVFPFSFAPRQPAADLAQRMRPSKLTEG
jgi:hypothetical protein